MKKYTIIFILLLSISFFGQEANKDYQFISPIFNYENNTQFKKGHNIRISRIKNDTVSFVFYKFSTGKNSEELNKIYYYIKNDGIKYDTNHSNSNDGNENLKNIKTFKLSSKDFNDYTTRYYPWFKGVSAGIFTVPFKLRIDDFDFEQNVNIGMNISFPFRMNRLRENEHLLTPSIGIGIGAINLNPKNSDLTNEENEEANRTASSFSSSLGLMYQFTDSINIGVQYGFDFLSNNDKDVRWKYDRKPWLGIGINIGFTISETKNSNVENTPDKSNIKLIQ